MRHYLLLLPFCIVGLSGCASTLLRSYDATLQPALRAVEQGQASQAADLHRQQRPQKPDLLFELEQGELLRSAGRFDESSASWQNADQLFRRFEDEGQFSWLDMSASLLTNDKALPYAGHDYERVLLNVRLALNHIAAGRWNDARVEVRRAHEMEARIAEARRRDSEKLEQAARERQMNLPATTDIGGYPVDIIDAPEVLALKNSYQTALSHYLAGFVYEALGDTALAAAGYRQAIELQGRQPQLEQSLRELDKRVHWRGPLIDTLILVESDWAPAKVGQNVNLPIPVMSGSGLYTHRWLSVSFPSLRLQPARPADGWQLNGQPVALDLLTDTSLLARRALHDEMPGIILRTSIRAASRWAASRTLDKRSSNGNGNDSSAALLSGLIQLAGIVAEQADDRSWRSLPGRFYIARVRLPPGQHTLKVAGQSAPLTFDIQPGPRAQLKVVRWIGNTVQLVQ